VRGLVLLLLALAGPAAAQERIVEIRVHGNHTTPEADILTIAGLSTGGSPTEDALTAAQRRLRDSGRFEGAEVLKRYRSIANADEVLVMIVVDELASVSETDLTPGPLRRLRAAGMWMPILSHADGYGFTYGAQTAFVNPLGRNTRLSIPLTWGGERRAAAELERTFDSGPIDVVRGTFSVNRRVNPFYLASDRRFETKVRGERAVTDWLRAGAGARITDNSFGAIEDRTRAVGADVKLDTRRDPSFPRNAVFVEAGMERLAFDPDAPRPLPVTWASRAVRSTIDARGYVGVGGSAVLAVRGSATLADDRLPLFEHALLGGSDSVRGYRTGHRAGDNAASASIELRYPLTSPINRGRFGVKAFVDGGTAWAHGERMRDQEFDRGVGGGVFFGIGPLTLDLDVAKPRTGNPRAHFGMGLTF
jgi:outer membrane protein assembly factor BamA